jgi:hypothetical protein
MRERTEVQIHHADAIFLQLFRQSAS